VTKVLTQQGRKVAQRLLVIQTLLAIIASLAFMVIDFKAGYSAFIGGMICVMPNLVFVIYAYRFGGARAAKKIASSFYRGETLKIMLTALMFAVTFIFIPIAIGPLMTTYALCLLVFWFAPLFT
jgi:ATP synthase protein I